MLNARYCNYKELQMSCGEKLAEEIRQKGYRVTPQRGVILETIAHMGGHLSVPEVFSEARARLPGLNITTIYRTLETLHRAGMVDLFYSGSGPTRFALRDPDQAHGHLVCSECDLVFDIDESLIAHLAEEVVRETGFSIDPHHLTLVGVCEDCLSKGKRRNS
jgi:Fur family ferric uptake transcriptional regulator